MIIILFQISVNTSLHTCKGIWLILVAIRFSYLSIKTLQNFIQIYWKSTSQCCPRVKNPHPLDCVVLVVFECFDLFTNDCISSKFTDEKRSIIVLIGIFFLFFTTKFNILSSDRLFLFSNVRF